MGSAAVGQGLIKTVKVGGSIKSLVSGKGTSDGI